MIVLDTNVVSELLYGLARLPPRREREGQPVTMADAQIAATCLAHGAQLATRNVRHFEGLGLVWVNPWLA